MLFFGSLLLAAIAARLDWKLSGDKQNVGVAIADDAEGWKLGVGV